MENVEIEYKVMINKKGYDKLISFFSLSTFIKQTNFYFDTPNDDLRSKHLSLRIRQIDDKYIATLKETLPIGKLETEIDVDGNSINDLPEEIISILLKYKIDTSKLINFAELTTIRSEVKIEDDLLCIDHSFYYGKEDFEIECESSSLEKAKETIENILYSQNIQFEKSKLTKIARARKNRR